MLHDSMLIDCDGGTKDQTEAQSTAGAAQTQGLPHTVLKLQCSFPPEIFDVVMLNLIRNPNITSSHLFRADILFDHTYDQHDHGRAASTQHLKEIYRPRPCSQESLDEVEWHLERTIVRELIPRNIRLDKPLVQTCHFFAKQKDGLDEHRVVYVPHVDDPEQMPFYHPVVQELSFLHQWRSLSDQTPSGHITLLYLLFDDDTQVTERLQRTGLRLLDTVHKHGNGQLAGYEKRVHLDRVIPQKTYQDTYTRLKVKYGRHLSDSWVEVTDPGKHVFEDIGIAAFMVELWRTMYRDPSDDQDTRPPFPGFADIGCGNGILTYILISEGYNGIGFDARRRKTWSIFPEDVQKHLQQRLLVPEIFNGQDAEFHDGRFASGTFIISNHADELTAWTPLLAYLNQGAFIAIPCCSHNLAGARFRAPSTVKGRKEVARLPQQLQQHDTAGHDLALTQAAETGSLKRTLVQKKMQSAYSTLCSYIGSLTEAVGFEVEKEVLRIPSTRNHSIIGRKCSSRTGFIEDDAARRAAVCKLVEEELDRDLPSIAEEWIKRAEQLAQKPGSGH